MQWPCINPASVCVCCICLFSRRRMRHTLFSPLKRFAGGSVSQVLHGNRRLVYTGWLWNLIYRDLQWHDTHFSPFLSSHLSFLAIHFLSFLLHHSSLLFMYNFLVIPLSLFLLAEITLFLSFPSFSSPSSLLLHTLLILLYSLLLLTIFSFLSFFFSCLHFVLPLPFSSSSLSRFLSPSPLLPLLNKTSFIPLFSSHLSPFVTSPLL